MPEKKFTDGMTTKGIASHPPRLLGVLGMLGVLGLLKVSSHINAPSMIKVARLVVWANLEEVEYWISFTEKASMIHTNMQPRLRSPEQGRQISLDSMQVLPREILKPSLPNTA